MVHYKVRISWPRVTTTQVDADVDLSDFNLHQTSRGYIRLFYSGKPVLLHRYIMGLAAGDKRQIHHVNGDKTDNRRYNLRIVTTSENIRANGKRRNNTSGMIGVFKRRSDGKYEARLQARINGKMKFKHLGRYRCKNEAGRAYDAAVRARGGDYMALNFPDE